MLKLESAELQLGVVCDGLNTNELKCSLMRCAKQIGRIRIVEIHRDGLKRLGRGLLIICEEKCEFHSCLLTAEVQTERPTYEHYD